MLGGGECPAEESQDQVNQQPAPHLLRVLRQKGLLELLEREREIERGGL